jgi:aspartate/methionine/tyrosine aminotransferase
MNSTDFCWRLIDEYQVAVTPGADFGTHQADNHVRFAYTTDERSIAVGLERIDDALRVWGVTK